MQVDDGMVGRAIIRFRAAVNAMKMCSRCTGRGYHHGYGEDGCDPDWCEECGGSQFVAEFTEEQAMRQAIEAALISD